MKKKLIYFIIFVLFLSVVLADDPRYVFGRNKLIEIRNPCYVNSTLCPSDVQCNITVRYPSNGSVYVENQNMTRQTTEYNYTLEYPTQGGLYPVDMICCYGAACGVDNFSILLRWGSWQELTPMTVIVALISIFFGCLLLFYIMDDEHIALKYFFLFLAVFILFIVIPSALISENLVMSFYSISKWFFYIFIAYVMVYSIYFIYLKFVLKAPGEEDQQ